MPTKDFSPEAINKRRLEAVRLRLDGHSVAQVAARTGLSVPTVSAAWKAFREGGWEAVPLKPRGRKAGQANVLEAEQQARLRELLTTLPPPPSPGWTRQLLAEALQAGDASVVSPRAIDHWLAQQDLKPAPLALEALTRRRSQPGRWYRQQVAPVQKQVKQANGSAWQGGVRIARPRGQGAPDQLRYQLYLHGKRGTLYTRVLAAPPLADDYLQLFERLLDQAAGKPAVLVFHGAWFAPVPEINHWLEANPAFRLLPWPAG
ncbi:helix-turn-helix domain-containing protein [Halomonas mongoliensis]|uniref:helix-turn-helix domain-containing protein n=1 Tax=Halomonas mongoliensis TaxID=321265 RepID=UPI00403B32BC